jgi:hypothetical protein
MKGSYQLVGMLEMDPAGQGRGRLLGKIRWL